MIPDDDNKDGIALTGATETLPEYIKGTPPSIERLRQGFDDARSDPDEGMRRNQKARDYFDGPGQLSSEVRSTLKARNQPAIYTNRIRPAINGVLGVLESARSDPQAYPRNPDDQNSADVVSKVLRYIADNSDFGDVKMEVAESFLVEGTGAVVIEMDGDDIVATQIRWKEFYADRYSRRNDFGDARYIGMAKWMDADQVTEKWRVRIEELGDPLKPDGIGILGNDKFDDVGDDGSGWINTRRRRVLVVEEYRIVEGEWKRIVYIASGVLEYGPSPYLDDKRRPANPIIATSCYVDAKNWRYGPIQDMIPIQDELNAGRSRALHLDNSRQLQFDPSSGAPPVAEETARIEAARPDGIIPAGWSVVSNAERTQSSLLRMQDAKGEIERMGPTPAVLGRQEGVGQSGRARLVSQQAGLTELARPLARLNSWELRCYRAMWDRARQFKDQPWFVRTTDDTKAMEFLQVNEPQMGEIPQQVQDPATGAVFVQMVPGIVGYNNRLAEMDVDIILDTTPDTANLQQEVWAELTNLVTSAGGLAAVSTPEFKVMLEISPLDDKTRIIEKLDKFTQERDQSQVAQLTAQVQQLSAALEEKQAVSTAEAGAKIELTQAQTAKTLADAHKTATDADTGQAQLYAGLGIDPLQALAD
jgi:hypothetical protein